MRNSNRNRIYAFIWTKWIWVVNQFDNIEVGLEYFYYCQTGIIAGSLLYLRKFISF